MDFAAILLLPLLGGYCFAYVWWGTAHRTKQVEGHHLYFRASLCGIILFACSLALHATLNHTFPGYRKLDLLLLEYTRALVKDQSGLLLADRIIRAEWVIAALYSLVLGMSLGPLMNRFTSRRWASRRGISELYGFLIRALEQEASVSLTLSTGKVYIGGVMGTPEPSAEPVAVSIKPMFSGYRDSEGRVNLTTDYNVIYAKLESGNAAQLNLSDNWRAQFGLTIRADEIVTAGPFSPAIFTEFNPGWRERIGEPATQTAAAAGGAKKNPASADDPPEDPPEGLPGLPSYVLSSIGTNRRFSGPM